MKPVDATAPSDPLPTLTLRPIGVLRTPHQERLDAPRQSVAAANIAGEIHLVAGMNLEHAIEDLETWEYVWVIFWFHLNQGWRPKVLPPRSERRHGVLATRSPHRPNPLGLSVFKLERVAGLTLYVRGMDVVDGTPVLDIKPYVPYCDAIPDARSGWMDAPADPLDAYELTFTDLARSQLRFLREEHGLADLESAIAQVLSLGPHPHPYRRIKPHGDHLRLALKEWRVDFVVEARTITVLGLESGYRPRELVTGGAALAAHRAFTTCFITRGPRQ